jgi:ribosomal-protein-alanine N-acetyltransferase
MAVVDIAEVLPHEDELFGSESWTADSYRAELADRRYRQYVIGRDDDGAMVGWAGLMVIAETAQILTIGVVTSAQRLGFGQQLLDVLLGQARERGASEVTLEVRVDNEAAIGLYERNGFRTLRIRRGYYELGRVDALEMRRVL